MEVESSLTLTQISCSKWILREDSSFRTTQTLIQLSVGRREKHKMLTILICKITRLLRRWLKLHGKLRIETSSTSRTISLSWNTLHMDKERKFLNRDSKVNSLQLTNLSMCLAWCRLWATNKPTSLEWKLALWMFTMSITSKTI